MPTFSNNSWGTFSYTVPAGATNVNFSFAGAGGGGSKPVGGEWYIENGASGRAGNFTINSRSYAYTLTFYLGRRGFDGFNTKRSQSINQAKCCGFIFFDRAIGLHVSCGVVYNVNET